MGKSREGWVSGMCRLENQRDHMAADYAALSVQERASVIQELRYAFYGNDAIEPRLQGLVRASELSRGEIYGHRRLGRRSPRVAESDEGS